MHRRVHTSPKRRAHDVEAYGASHARIIVALAGYFARVLSLSITFNLLLGMTPYLDQPALKTHTARAHHPPANTYGAPCLTVAASLFLDPTAATSISRVRHTADHISNSASFAPRRFAHLGGFGALFSLSRG